MTVQLGLALWGILSVPCALLVGALFAGQDAQLVVAEHAVAPPPVDRPLETPEVSR